MKQLKRFNYERKDGLPKLKAGVFGRFKTGQYLKPPGYSGFKSALRKYKLGAGQRGLLFELSESEFRALITANCHYCGSEPSMISYCPKQRTSEAFERSKFMHNGVDRVNNLLGYTLLNCVPCCTYCNRGKSTRTTAEFTKYLDQIAAFRGLRA